tara:strand:- start:796 stop:1020 length:225 start_codon:yes stop_codon:yes gene_type:complete
MNPKKSTASRDTLLLDMISIPVSVPTHLNQCGTYSIVYPPTVRLRCSGIAKEDYQALENDQWQRDQDEMEEESR